MSLFLGSWQYMEGSSPAFALQQMYDAIALFSNLSPRFSIHQQTGFGHLLTDNTPEAKYENLPVFLQQEQILFTSQGRIDNREQLARHLSLSINRQYPDGEEMLQAYLRWGKDCVHHLRGDWSFAVFDYKKQELFIARDPMGYTAIYYYQDNSGFYFSSSIKSLLALPNYQKRVNEAQLVRKLALWRNNDTDTAHDTFYKDIYSLPIAHTLTVKDKKTTLKKYWEPQNIPLRHYKDKQNYADEMLGLLTVAVKARLRSSKPVASMLSGGLDSSTVSFIAADLLKSQNKPLTTLSHIPLFAAELLKDQQGVRSTLDETSFINAVAGESGNIRPILLDSAGYSVLKGIIDTLNICSEPLHAACNLYWLQDIYKTASQKGFGALLSGEGGNGSISFAGIDYLLPFNFNTLRQHPYRFFKKQIAKPLILKYFSEQLNKKRRSNNSREKYILNIFMQPGILEQYKVIQDIRENNNEFSTRYISNIQERKNQFIELYNVRSTIGAALGHYYGLDPRDPTTDIDLMEYFFSIPNEVFFDEHYNNRMLVKRMMKGKVPDKVLFEKKPGLQSADIVYRVKAQQQEITAAIEALQHSPAANHYIDVKLLAANWRQYLQQPYVKPYDMQRVLKALAFALFLQMNFD
ncbi:MAG: asparagine synthase-related protein [Niabella sp.]